MQPVYTLTKGLSIHAIRKAVGQALEKTEEYQRREYLPAKIREKYELAEYNFAIRNIHFPKDMDSYVIARKRLVFEEFFLFLLAIRRLKEANDITKNAYPMEGSKETEQFLNSLPFQLTRAQERV